LGQEALDQIFEEFWSILRKPDDALPHDLIEFPLGIRIVGRTSDIELIQDHAELVPIHHPVMPSLVDDFKRKIGRSAAEGLVHRINIIRLLGEAEVGDEGVAITI
jgi:hypothetical protein